MAEVLVWLKICVSSGTFYFVYMKIHLSSFRSQLEDIENAWGGKGYCHCNKCENEDQSKSYPGECPEQNSQCVSMYPNYPNKTVEKICNEIPCSSCKSVRQCTSLLFDPLVAFNSSYVISISYLSRRFVVSVCSVSTCTVARIQL